MLEVSHKLIFSSFANLSICLISEFENFKFFKLSKHSLSWLIVLAPIKAAVLPLTKKDGMPQKARKIMQELQSNFNCQYEEKDSIGKRYRRQDAIGTPYCITVDHQTLEDNTVTLRDRDAMSQCRVDIKELNSIISKKVNIANYLE